MEILSGPPPDQCRSTATAIVFLREWISLQSTNASLAPTSTTSIPFFVMIISPTPHLLGVRSQPTEQEEAAIRAALVVQQEELRRANSQVAKARSVLTSLNTEWEHMILYAFDDNNPKKGALVQVVGEICDAQRHLDTSLQRRNEIQHFVDSHSAIITSMAQWLLSDVLSEIFLHVDRSYNVRTPSYKRMSVTLSHVCRHWRNVAFSTPLLWNSFTDHKLRWDFTKFWIESARDAPLNLRIIHSDKFDPELLALYSSYRSRWKELSLTIPAVTIGIIPPTRDHTPNDVPLLEHLDITVLPPVHNTENRVIRPESFPWLQDILNHAPNIRSLTWEGAVIPSSVVWSRLTKVNLRNITALQALVVLAEAKNVEEFTGVFTKEDMETLPQTPLRIQSDSLRHLNLSFHRSHKFNIHHVLFSLTCPVLSYLKLACPAWWPQKALLNLIERSTASLDELVLQDCKYLKPAETMELWKSDLLKQALIRMDVNWYNPVVCNALTRALQGPWEEHGLAAPGAVGAPTPTPVAAAPPHAPALLGAHGGHGGHGPHGGHGAHFNFLPFLAANMNGAGAHAPMHFNMGMGNLNGFGTLPPLPPMPHLPPQPAPAQQGNPHMHHGNVGLGIPHQEMDDPLLSRRARLVPGLKAVLRFGPDVPEYDPRMVAAKPSKTRFRFLDEEFDVYLEKGGPSPSRGSSIAMPVLTADSTAEQLVFERVLDTDGSHVYYAEGDTVNVTAMEDANTPPSVMIDPFGDDAEEEEEEDEEPDANVDVMAPFGPAGPNLTDWDYVMDDSDDDA